MIFTVQIYHRWRASKKLRGNLARSLVAFLTEYAVVDRIIRHLELTFVAEKPPPARVFEPVALMAAEESGEYE